MVWIIMNRFLSALVTNTFSDDLYVTSLKQNVTQNTIMNYTLVE